MISFITILMQHHLDFVLVCVRKQHNTNTQQHEVNTVSQTLSREHSELQKSSSFACANLFTIYCMCLNFCSLQRIHFWTITEREARAELQNKEPNGKTLWQMEKLFPPDDTETSRWGRRVRFIPSVCVRLCGRKYKVKRMKERSDDRVETGEGIRANKKPAERKRWD